MRLNEGSVDSNPMREVLDLLYRGKWIIIGCFLLVSTAFGIYNYRIDPEYEAYALIYVSSEQTSDVGQVLGFGGNSGWWGYANERLLANELVILEQSLGLGRSVVDSLMYLQTVPSTNEPLLIIRNKDGELLPRDEVIRRLSRVVDFDVEGGGVDFIRITAVSNSPAEAALLANLYADAFKMRTRNTSRQRVAGSRAFLETQERKLSRELHGLEQQIADFMTRERAVALDAEAERIIGQMAELEAERDIAEIELSMAQSKAEKLQEQLAAIEPRLAERLASGVQENLRRAQQELAERTLQRDLYIRNNPEYGLADSNPLDIEGINTLNADIRRLETEVSRLSAQFAQELVTSGRTGIDFSSGGSEAQFLVQLNRQLAEAEIQASGLEQRLRVINDRLALYNREIQDIPEQATELAQLERSRLANERMYLFIVEKLNETRVAEESVVGYADIIREALIPRVPVRPDKVRNLILGSLLGLMLGFGIAFLRLKMDTRVYRPEDLKAVGLNVLGIISRISRENEESVSPGNGDANKSMLDEKLVTLYAPLSPTAEMYRQIRTNIQFSRPDIVVQTLMVSSAGASEGKTTTVLNLAITMAQAGRKTLIMDADLRRPRIHKVFNVPREPGVADVLFEEDVDFEQYATDIDNLYLMPAGTMVPNTSELIGSKRMRDFFDKARAHFDIVIVDTSPVLIATDAVLLSTQCDATLIVINSGNTEQYEFEQCVEVLKSVGAKIIGGVLNGFDSSLAKGYSYKYRYYQYGYGYKYRSYYDYYQPTED